MTEIITITITPALPCCALAAVKRRCGQPATVAQATQLADGSYHLQPFCTTCTTAMARTYGLLEEEEPDA